MSDVEKLLSDYIAEHRAGGEADPLEYLKQVEGLDRQELEVLIDAYLARAPGREWDQEAFKGSQAEQLAEGLARALRGQSGLWPTLLPRLRNRAKLKRAELVERLAGELDVPDRKEKVGRYYHEMEQGLLPVAGVSDRVLEALGRLLGRSASALRKAGESLSPGPGGPEQAVFARTALPSAEFDASEAPPKASPGTAVAIEELDEVDRLFRGG